MQTDKQQISPLLDQDFLKRSLAPVDIEERRRFEELLIRYKLGGDTIINNTYYIDGGEGGGLDIGFDDKYSTLHWNEDTGEYFWGAEGVDNCYIGKHLGFGEGGDLSLGSLNVGVGVESAGVLRSAVGNVWMGNKAFAHANDPAYSIAIGYESAYWVDGGRANVFIGARTAYYTDDVSTAYELHETPSFTLTYEIDNASYWTFSKIHVADGKMWKWEKIVGNQQVLQSSEDAITWTTEATVDRANYTAMFTSNALFNGVYHWNWYNPIAGEGWIISWDGINLGWVFSRDDYYPLSPQHIYFPTVFSYKGVLYGLGSHDEYIYTDYRRAAYWSIDGVVWTKVTYYGAGTDTYVTYGALSYPDAAAGYETIANMFIEFKDELYWFCPKYETGLWRTRIYQLTAMNRFSLIATLSPDQQYTHPFLPKVVGDYVYVWEQELGSGGGDGGATGCNLSLYRTSDMLTWTKVKDYGDIGTINAALWSERELLIACSSRQVATLSHVFVYNINLSDFSIETEGELTPLGGGAGIQADLIRFKNDIYVQIWGKIYKRTVTNWYSTELGYDLQASYNTFVGAYSGYVNIEGQGVTLLGAFADVSQSNLFNATAIGYKSIVDTDNTLILGGVGTYAVKVGIGRTTAYYTLDVYGDARFKDQVAISEATGTSPLDVNSTTVCTNLNADLWDGYHAFFSVTGEPTGFVNRTGSTLSWNAGNRTLTITGTGFVVYYDGTPYTLNTDSSQVVDTSAFYWFYYEVSGSTLNLVNSTTFPGFDVPLVATVYWNTVAGMDKGLVADERHGIVMDAATHEYLHETIGCRYESGLAGTFADATFSIAAGYIHDEDVDFQITPAKSACDVLYLDGSATWKWLENQTVYYYTTGGSLYYNNGTTLTAVPANQYVAAWIFATPSPVRPIVAIIGQRTDVTIADARANNKYESLSLGTLPFKEMKLLYRVILRNDVAPYEEAEDLRAVSNISSGTYVATNHNTLTGLATGDDHTQYAYCKISATAAPAVTDDLDNYREGTVWVEQDANVIWICADNADGAAVWHGFDQDLRAADSPSFLTLTLTEAVAAPMTITSTAAVTNLNADLLDGSHAADFAASAHAHALDDLSDVNAAAPGDGEVLTWDNGTSKWIAAAAAGGGAFLDLSDVDEADYTGHAGEFVVVNGTEDGLVFSASSVAGHTLGGASHTDVDAAAPNDNDILRFDTASGTWVAEALPAASNHSLLSATHDDTTASAVSQGSIIIGDGTPKWVELVVGTVGQVLTTDGTDVFWDDIPADEHDLLSATHTDVTASAVSRGSLIVGQDASPVWKELAIGAADTVLTSDGTDAAWAALPTLHRVGDLVLNESWDDLSLGALAGQGSYVDFGTWAFDGDGGANETCTVVDLGGGDYCFSIWQTTQVGVRSKTATLNLNNPVDGFVGMLARWKWRCSDVDKSGDGGFYLYDSVRTAVCWRIYWQGSSGRIVTYNGTTVSNVTAALSDNTWYEIQVLYQRIESTAGYILVWVDGVYMGSWSAYNTSSPRQLGDQIRMNIGSVAHAAECTIDCNDLQIWNFYRVNV